MPRVSKIKTTPPTIRQRASEEDDKTLTGAPEPSVQTSTANVDRAQLAAMKPRIEAIFEGAMSPEDVDAVKKAADKPILLTFHLRRVDNELTDTMRTVHIPSPAMVKDGERVVIHVYREE